MSGTTIAAKPLTVAEFKPISAGAMRGFIDVLMSSGLVLHRCTLFAKDDRAWVGPPSKQVIGRDGTVQRTADNKVRYEAVVSFKDRATQDRWSAAVIEAVRSTYPEALA